LLDLKNQRLIPSHIGPAILGPKNLAELPGCFDRKPLLNPSQGFESRPTRDSRPQCNRGPALALGRRPQHRHEHRSKHYGASIIWLVCVSLSYLDLLSEKSVLSSYEKARNHANFNHLRELNQQN